jgi:hypothetical protein
MLLLSKRQSVTSCYQQKQGEISGSHGGEYEEDCLLDIAPCSLAEVYRRFRGACCLHHQGLMIEALKRRSISTRLHDATSQTTVIFILVAVKT